MTPSKVFLVALVNAIILGINPAQADSNSRSQIDPEKKCGGQIEECFAQSGPERSNCFNRAAESKSCTGTLEGKLAYRRWAMSPVKIPGYDTAPAFMGPQLIDQDCLAKFDNQWSGSLVKGDYSADKVTQLETNLDGCKKEITNDLVRP